MKNLLTLCMILLVGISCKSKVTNPETQLTYKDVDVAGAKKMIADNSDLVILDVRTPEETAKGMLPNAIEIDFYGDDFEEKISKLDKDKSYLVYCRSGGRSVSASNKMIEKGFTDITNMLGGYNAWSE